MEADFGPLTGAEVRIRALSAEDIPRLAAITLEPAVARRWGPVPVDELVQLVAITLEDEVIGGIQYEEHDEHPMYRHASIDIFLSTPWHGRGLGTDAVRTLARWLIDVRGHHRLTIDPAADNAAAIRCYEKAGFRPVGLMRQYERDPVSGEWHDGLLMDLLASELCAKGAT